MTFAPFFLLLILSLDVVWLSVGSLGNAEKPGASRLNPMAMDAMGCHIRLRIGSAENFVCLEAAGVDIAGALRVGEALRWTQRSDADSHPPKVSARDQAGPALDDS